MEITKPSINLFIVGAAKSGTTSLYNYLSQHPDTFFPPVKEPNYYSRAESHNLTAYLSPKKGQSYHNKIIRDRDIYYSLFEGSDNYSVVADSSPSYLWDDQAAEKIYSDYPDAKILIILRNPVDRAFSQYLMDLRDGNQKEQSFMDALELDIVTEPKIWGRAHLYKELGLYNNQVKSYLNLFKENTKVIIYEEFIKDIEVGLVDVLDFMDLDTSKIDMINYQEVHNPFKVHRGGVVKWVMEYKNKFVKLKNLLPTSIKIWIKNRFLFVNAPKPKLSDQVRQKLSNEFKQDIVDLEVTLKRDLRLWKDKS